MLNKTKIQELEVKASLLHPVGNASPFQASILLLLCSLSLSNSNPIFSLILFNDRNGILKGTDL